MTTNFEDTLIINRNLKKKLLADREHINLVQYYWKEAKDRDEFFNMIKADESLSESQYEVCGGWLYSIMSCWKEESNDTTSYYIGKKEFIVKLALIILNIIILYFLFPLLAGKFMDIYHYILTNSTKDLLAKLLINTAVFFITVIVLFYGNLNIMEKIFAKIRSHFQMKRGNDNIFLTSKEKMQADRTVKVVRKMNNVKELNKLQRRLIELTADFSHGKINMSEIQGGIDSLLKKADELPECERDIFVKLVRSVKQNF